MTITSRGIPRIPKMRLRLVSQPTIPEILRVRTRHYWLMDRGKMKSIAWRWTVRLRPSGALHTPTVLPRMAFGRRPEAMFPQTGAFSYSPRIGRITWARNRTANNIERTFSLSNCDNRNGPGSQGGRHTRTRGQQRKGDQRSRSARTENGSLPGPSPGMAGRKCASSIQFAGLAQSWEAHDQKHRSQIHLSLKRNFLTLRGHDKLSPFRILSATSRSLSRGGGLARQTSVKPVGPGGDEGMSKPRHVAGCGRDGHDFVLPCGSER